jgi:hypothetical protein
MPISQIVTNSIATGAVTSADLAAGAARSNFGAGAVLQVVQSIATASTFINTTNETAVTGMSASITPSATSSRILVMITIGEFRVPLGDGSMWQLYRNGSKIANMINEASYSSVLTASANFGLTFAWSVVDSPSSTSALTYALYGRKLLNGQAAALQIMPNSSSNSSIILMEIAG